MRFHFLSYYNCIKLNYVHLEDTWRVESKELFLLQQKNLFPVQIFLSQDSLVTCPFPFLVWRFFSPLILDLRLLHISCLSFHRFIMVLSFFLSLVPFSILCYFATPPIISLGFPHPSLEPSLLSCHPLRVLPLLCPTSFLLACYLAFIP